MGIERIGSLQVDRSPDRMVLHEQSGPAIGNMVATAIMTFFMGFCLLRLLGWNDPPLLGLLGVAALACGFAAHQDARSAESLGHYDVTLRLALRTLELPITHGRLSPVLVMVDEILKLQIVDTSDGTGNAHGVVLEATGGPETIAVFRRSSDAERLHALMSTELRKMRARFFSEGGAEGTVI